VWHRDTEDRRGGSSALPTTRAWGHRPEARGQAALTPAESAPRGCSASASRTYRLVAAMRTSALSSIAALRSYEPTPKASSASIRRRSQTSRARTSTSTPSSRATRSSTLRCRSAAKRKFSTRGISCGSRLNPPHHPSGGVARQAERENLTDACNRRYQVVSIRCLTEPAVVASLDRHERMFARPSDAPISVRRLAGEPFPFDDLRSRAHVHLEAVFGLTAASASTFGGPW
jgi:hypothetical protein